MLKHLISFCKVSQSKPCSGGAFVHAAKEFETVAMVHLPFRNLGIWDVLCLSSEPECGEEAYCRGRYLFGNRTGHYRCGAFLLPTL